MSATLSRSPSLFLLLLAATAILLAQNAYAVQYNITITQNITLNTGNNQATQYSVSQSLDYSQTQKQATQITEQATVNPAYQWSMAQYRLVELGIGYMHQGYEGGQQIWNETPATYTYNMYPVRTIIEYRTVTTTITKTITLPNGETTVVTEVKTITIPGNEQRLRPEVLGLGALAVFLLLIAIRLR